MKTIFCPPKKKKKKKLGAAEKIYHVAHIDRTDLTSSCKTYGSYVKEKVCPGMS